MAIGFFSKQSGKKWLLIVASVFVLLIALVIGRAAYLYYHPYTFDDLRFELYYPTKLPTNIVIKEATLWADMPAIRGVWHPWFFWLIPHELTLKINVANDPHNDKGIGQWKANSIESPIIHPCSDYPANTCAMRKTPNNQEYQYLKDHGIFYGEFSNQEQVSFIKNGTIINASFPIANDQLIPETEWNEFIDSFVPVAPETVTLRHTSSEGYRP